MDEKVMQFRVGVVVLATLIITAILLVLFGKLPSLVGSYTIYVRFGYAPGITDGTPVRKSGVLIGRVTNVQLADHQEQVLVTLKIDKNMAVYQNEDCFLTRDSLVAADTSLSFVPDPQRELLRGKRIEPGSEIKGHLSDDPTGLKRALQGPINTVEETGRALRDASLKLGKAAKDVDDLLETERQRIHDVLDNAAASLKAFRTVIGDQETQQRLGEAMKKLPETLDTMNQTFRSADSSLRKFTEATGPDQKTSVERMVETIEMMNRSLRKFTESTDPSRPPPIDQIADAMSNVNEITRLLRQVMDRIDRGDGSLGALLNDRQLYDRLNRAARNVEQVTRDIRPIVEDARVFSDKVSRHPGVLLRDAVRPGVGLK